MQVFIGTVVRTDGPQVSVRDENAREWRCVLRGRLRRLLAGATNPLAVGDRVEVKPAGSGEGTVEKLLPRRSRLARRAVMGHDAAHRGKGIGRPPREHVLAANLDLVVVVVPAPPRPTVIDRYLALAAKGGCSAVVCVNKTDLVDPSAAAAAMNPYREAGVPVLFTSALTGEGTDTLLDAQAGKLVAFVGPSGGGKSSLLTPGLREIGFLEDEGRQAADDLFPEITALAEGCRFRDCTHTHEPRCAVKGALDAGDLDPELYRRYSRLARSGRL